MLIKTFIIPAKPKGRFKHKFKYKIIAEEDKLTHSDPECRIMHTTFEGT